MDYMDELKEQDLLIQAKVLDANAKHTNKIIYVHQWPGMRTMFDAKIEGNIISYHITQLGFKEQSLSKLL